ncbi:MAG: hypothetical protein ACE5G1_11570 [bacterium]
MHKRYDQGRHPFQGPFKNIHIDRNEYLLHLSRYAHINPVETNLVPKPEDWEFSSFRIIHSLHRTLTGFRTLSVLEILPLPALILSQFPDREANRQFVMEYKDDSNISRFTLE